MRKKGQELVTDILYTRWSWRSVDLLNCYKTCISKLWSIPKMAMFFFNSWYFLLVQTLIHFWTKIISQCFRGIWSLSKSANIFAKFWWTLEFHFEIMSHLSGKLNCCEQDLRAIKESQTRRKQGGGKILLSFLRSGSDTLYIYTTGPYIC